MGKWILRVFFLLLGAAGLWAMDGSEPADAVACSTTPAFGPIYDCSIAAPAEVDSFTVTGATGDRLRVRVVEKVPTLTAAIEVRKGATTVCGLTTAEIVNCTLTSNGTFTIRVTGNAGTTGTYALWVQPLNNPTGCPVKAANTTTAANMGAVGEVDCYKFTGNTGDLWMLRNNDTSPLYTYVEIIKPDGSTLSPCGVSGNEFVECTLDTTGTHTILIYDYATNTGAYSLYLQKLNNPLGCTTLTAGTGLTPGTITAQSEVDCYRFAGTNGHRWRTRVLETSPSLVNAYIRILRPNGTTVCGFAAAEINTCALDITGNHTILIVGGTTQTGNYKLYLNNLTAIAGTCPVKAANTTTAANMGAVGEVDCYKFTGNTGDLWMLRNNDTSPLYTYVEIIKPDGSTLSPCGVSGNEFVECTLDTTGTHTILIYDYATNTGAYSLYLQKLNNPLGCTTLTAGTGLTPGTITAQSEVDCYRFAGTNGHRWRTRVLETSPSLVNAYIRILRPNGTTVCGFAAAEINTCALDITGNHTILIVGGTTQTGNYKLYLNNLTAIAGTCPVKAANTTTAANMGAVGEVDCYKFTGNTGDLWMLRNNDTSPLYTYVEIIKPDGSTLSPCGVSGNEFVECTLDTTGTHTILIYDYATNTGAYSLYLQKLNNPLGCTTLTAGTGLTPGTITTQSEVDCYRFAGTNGHRWRTRVLETSPSLVNAYIRILRPNGTTVCGFAAAEINTCALDITGNHTILIVGGTTQTGNYKLYLNNLTAIAGTCPVKAANTTTAANMGAVGEVDCYKFTGNTGDLWMLRNNDTSPLYTYVEIIKPDGSTLSPCGVSGNEFVECVLDTTGTHTILIYDYATNTGAYSLYLQKLNNPLGCTTLTAGTGLTPGTITTQSEVDCYRFAGTNGHRWRTRVLETSPSLVNAYIRILRPNGTTVCGFAAAEINTCALDITGNHTILIVGGTTQTGNYKLYLNNLNNPTGCTTLTNNVAVSSNISTSGEVDCYRLTGTAGQTWQVTLNEAAAMFAYAEVIRSDGTTVCGPTGTSPTNCVLTTNGTHTILVHDSGAAIGNYNVKVKLV